MLLDAFPALFLRSHEEDILALGNQPAYQVNGLFKILLCLFKVDDMDTVPGHEDIILHPGFHLFSW